MALTFSQGVVGSADRGNLDLVQAASVVEAYRRRFEFQMDRPDRVPGEWSPSWAWRGRACAVAVSTWPAPLLLLRRLQRRQILQVLRPVALSRRTALPVAARDCARAVRRVRAQRQQGK